jgi:hypothetical protein
MSKRADRSLDADPGKLTLIGSASRDLFKAAHKQLLEHSNPRVQARYRPLYACDIDFVIVEFKPRRGIVCYYDYKRAPDPIRATERVAYEAQLVVAPVFIVEGENPTEGPFDVYEFMGVTDRGAKDEKAILEHRIFCKNWLYLAEWEYQLRIKYRQATRPAANDAT